MVTVSATSMIQTRHFVVVYLVGQVLSVMLNTNVTVHQVHYVLAIPPVYVPWVNSVLAVICYRTHAVLIRVRMVEHVYRWMYGMKQQI